MNFQQAVAQTREIQRSWQPGLQALKGADRVHITARLPRLLSGSVDLDASLARRYPNANRWDYGIGRRGRAQANDQVYWVEVHAATAQEVPTVLRKLGWLRSWLSSSQFPLRKPQPEFIWVSSGRTSSSLAAPIRKSLAERHGLFHAGHQFTID